MQIITSGIDTVRPRYQITDHLPVNDPNFATEMNAEGWTLKHSQFNDKHGQPVQSYTYSRTNDTLREFIMGGEYYYAEFSAPRMDGSEHNLNLSTPDYVRDCIQGVADNAPFNIEFDRINRVDTSVDIAAHEAMPAVISAAQQIRLPRTRKVTRHIYPGQTATVRGAQLSMRCYSKSHELKHKLRKSHDPNAPVIILTSQQQGRTRIEFQNQFKKGFTMEHLDDYHNRIAYCLEYGFPSGSVYVAGLHNIRAQIDGMDIHATTKNSLLAFAVRYAELGEDGMRTAYNERTFRRHKRKFLDHGLRLDDVCSWEGEVDFQPVINELRLAA